MLLAATLVLRCTATVAGVEEGLTAKSALGEASTSTGGYCLTWHQI